MDFPVGQDEQGNPFPDPDPAKILGPNPDEGWPKDEHPQQGGRQVARGFLEDLYDFDDLDAHVGGPGSFAFTTAEQDIDFHTSFEGMPPLPAPNRPANQGSGPTGLPEIGRANDSNDLAYEHGNGDAAMEQFYADDEGRVWCLYSHGYDSNGRLIATYRYIDDNGVQLTRQQIVPLIPSEQTFGQDNDRHDDTMAQQNQGLMHSQGINQGSPSYVPVGPPVEDYYGGQHGGSTSQELPDSLAPMASRLTAESPSGSAYPSVYSPRVGSPTHVISGRAAFAPGLNFTTHSPSGSQSTSANSEPGANSTPQPTMDQAVPVLVMDERSVNRPRDAFPIIFDNALKLGLEKLLDAGGVSFRIATMCSDTDGPILALREFVEAATACGYPGLLQYNHVFSVEIEPFKQAFIRRNAAPSGPIFRNVVDVGMPGATQAMTASGAMADIPLGIDILIAGSSCVDFSSLNYAKNDKKKKSGLNKLFERFKGRGVSAIQQDDPMASQVVDGLQQIFESIKDEKGESTKTFLSILMYAHAHRPKIVILENVTRAPWDQFKKFWLPSIGYEAAYVQVDSKNFLVPQTRQRKYLLGVDARYYGNKAEQIVNTWVKLMDVTQWFKNPPDLKKFLLPPSDPRVLQTRFQLERTLLSRPKRDVEAVHCAADHRSARRKEELGTSNPYTRMDDRGNVQPREDTWQGVISVYTWRMQDLLDIEYLRAQKKGYDFTHKMFILDVGQNVDRQSGRLGVIPCVLPSADLFISYDGRPLLGLECLAVQGIPVDRISLSVEGENQLKDLAGNAMTTTVAGAAILCALIAESRFKRKASNRHLQGLAQATSLLPSSIVHDNSTDEAGPSNLLDSFLTLDTSSLGRKTHTSSSRKGKEIDRSISASQTTPNKMAWQEIVSSGWDGNRSVEFFCTLCLNGCRKCRCDAFRKHQHTGVYLRCKDCNETRCQSCAGNPDHNFDRAHPIDDKVSIGRSLAQELAIAALPAHLYIDWAGTDTAHSIDILHELDKQIFSDHLEALHRAIQTCAGGVHYYQTDLKFRDDLTVTYESEKSTIVVVITGKDITWSMHLRPVYIEFGRPSIRNDTSASEVAVQLAALDYDLRQPLLKAVLTDHNADFTPTADN
ncbi:SNF2 super family protein [Colletotrichum scovillei]|uniref:SNF2 super family protein n=1 Tax=Colletotrichum scovillei TaxID=1209932 RepID=A0A9P7RDL6_9PEZI|nr:SNF2 super family protein [Colletotrichum scovillei]